MPAMPESVELLDRSLEVLVVVVGGVTTTTGGACTTTWPARLREHKWWSQLPWCWCRIRQRNAKPATPTTLIAIRLIEFIFLVFPRTFSSLVCE